MKSTKTIHIVSCHAEGEVGDVIVGGVAPPPGDTLWEQRNFIAQDKTLREFVLYEPRGGVFRHVNLLVPPKHPDADAAFIIMEPEDTPPMSGSNSICVATVLLDSGIIPMQEPITTLTLEAPGGLVHVQADCKDGKAERITVENLPSFVDKLGVTLEVEGLNALTVDTAYGGDSFVVVDSDKVGLQLSADEAHDIATLGVRITNAANEQLGFVHPENPDWKHISFCLCRSIVYNIDRIYGQIRGRNSTWQGRSLAYRYCRIRSHGNTCSTTTNVCRTRIGSNINHRFRIHRKNYSKSTGRRPICDCAFS